MKNYSLWRSHGTGLVMPKSVDFKPTSGWTFVSMHYCNDGSLQ